MESDISEKVSTHHQREVTPSCKISFIEDSPARRCLISQDSFIITYPDDDRIIIEEVDDFHFIDKLYHIRNVPIMTQTMAELTSKNFWTTSAKK